MIANADMLDWEAHIESERQRATEAAYPNELEREQHD